MYRSRLHLIFAGITALAVSSCATAAPRVANDVASQANPYGSYLAGRVAASEHDMPEAAKLYAQSLAQDPDNPDLLSRALLYTAGAGNVDDAAKLATRVVMTAPDDRIARLALAVSAIKRHDFADARSQIEKSAKGPFTALTLSLLDAWSAQGLGDTNAAIAALKDVPTEGGTAALDAYHRALILDLAGRDVDADAAYKEVLKLAPDSPRMVDAYGRFLERTNRAAEASALYARYPEDSSLAPIMLAARARVASGSKPERLVPTAEEGAAESLFGIAASLSDDASTDVAILYLQLALYLEPDFDLAKIVLADRLESLKKYPEAIAVYASIKSDSPYAFAAAVQIATDHGRIGDDHAEVAKLRALAAQRPTDLSIWTVLGDAYRADEKYAEAADAYDHAIKLLPKVTSKDWALFYARGVAEERSKNWVAAESDLQAALKLSPEQPQVLNYLGYSWVDQRRNLPQALMMLEKARALDANDGYIVDSVGWAYFRLGRYQDAAKTLEQAVLLVPGDPTINEHLGDAYWMIGRKLEAGFQWNHALAFGADDKQKALIEKKLQSGLSKPEKAG